MHGPARWETVGQKKEEEYCGPRAEECLKNRSLSGPYDWLKTELEFFLPPLVPTFQCTPSYGSTIVQITGSLPTAGPSPAPTHPPRYPCSEHVHTHTHTVLRLFTLVHIPHTPDWLQENLPNVIYCYVFSGFWKSACYTLWLHRRGLPQWWFFFFCVFFFLNGRDPQTSGTHLELFNEGPSLPRSIPHSFWSCQEGFRPSSPPRREPSAVDTHSDKSSSAGSCQLEPLRNEQQLIGGRLHIGEES